MKQLTCEMCGSTDMLKQDGVFVCQACGCKYSVEEAKKMMVEGVVEVAGTVKVDNAEKIKNMLVNAKRMFDHHDYGEAQELYKQVLNEDADNVEAILYERLSYGWQLDFSNFKTAKENYKGKGKKSVMHRARYATIDALRIVYNKDKEPQKEINKHEEKFFMSNVIDDMCDLAFWIATQCKKIQCKKLTGYSAWSMTAETVRYFLYFVSDILNEKDKLNYPYTLSFYDSLKEKTQKAKDINFNYSEELNWEKRVSRVIADELLIKLDKCSRQTLEEIWREYPDEKNLLDQEKQALEKEKDELEKSIAESRHKIEELEKEKWRLIPTEVERNSLFRERDNLILAKNKLGFF